MHMDVRPQCVRFRVTPTMESLKATIAREIIKASVTDAETLAVIGVSVSKPSEHLMQAGNFYFRLTLIQHVIKAPWHRRPCLNEKCR